MTTKINVFDSTNEIKWCPGCGDYAILATVKRTLNNLNIQNNNVVFVSGIGCAGRLPYYINTNGFHTLHGRAPAIATGLKITRPDLQVWIVIGDGDGFSIGLGHTLHLIRRNLNVNVLFINNKIYSLTKGQYSPTSKKNFITKSSPRGSIENNINPLSLVNAAGGTFIARTIDTDITTLSNIIEKAIEHKGTSFIEVLQNCNIFNDKAYDKFKNKENKNDNVIMLEDKMPLIFGSTKKKALVIKNLKLDIIDYDSNSTDVLFHDQYNENITQKILTDINDDNEHFPLPLGILKSVSKPTYDDEYHNKTRNKENITNLTHIFK